MSVAANQTISRQVKQRRKIPVAASTHIYQGTLVFVSATGYGDDDTASGVNRFAGIAVDEVDNSAGSAGDLLLEVWRDGVFALSGAGTFTQADEGKPVYATDNYTVTLNPAAAGAVRIGYVSEYVSATKLRVAIEPDDLNALKNQQGQIADASIVVGAENTNVRAITIQLKDEHGNDIAFAGQVKAVLYADAARAAYVATGGSTGIAIGTDGALLALVAKKAFLLTSEQDGDIDLTWTDTGTEAAYLALELPNGKIVMSDALTNT